MILKNAHGLPEITAHPRLLRHVSPFCVLIFFAVGSHSRESSELDRLDLEGDPKSLKKGITKLPRHQDCRGSARSRYTANCSLPLFLLALALSFVVYLKQLIRLMTRRDRRPASADDFMTNHR